MGSCRGTARASSPGFGGGGICTNKKKRENMRFMRCGINRERGKRETSRREKGTRAWAMDGVEDAEALGLPCRIIPLFQLFL